MPSTRTASWAPATVFSRLIATGRITPGNSTRLRTGRMINMSSGRPGALLASAPSFDVAMGIFVASCWSWFMSVLMGSSLVRGFISGGPAATAGSHRRGAGRPAPTARVPAPVGARIVRKGSPVVAVSCRPAGSAGRVRPGSPARPGARTSSMRSAGTPGSATSISTCSVPAYTSTGGSHRGCCRRSAGCTARRKNCRCRRSAWSSLSTASAHIHERISRRFIVAAACLIAACTPKWGRLVAMQPGRGRRADQVLLEEMLRCSTKLSKARMMAGSLKKYFML